MSEEQDLALLDQALTKFGLASDEQFPSLTATLLPPLLEKLGSSHNAVRTKVLKILSLVNQRYKASLDWKLPNSGLLSLLPSLPSSNALGSNFCVGYILASMEREGIDVQQTSLLGLINHLANFNANIQQHVLAAFVSNLELFKFKKSVEERKILFSFINNENTKRIFLTYMIDFLLYLPPPPARLNTHPLSPGHSQESEKNIKTTPLAGIQAQLPGTSFTQIGDMPLAQLSAKKVALVNFFADNLELFHDSDIYAAAIIASTDSINEVQRHGEHLFKRLSKDPLSNKQTLTQMFQLFMGQKNESTPTAPGGAPAAANPTPDLPDDYKTLRKPVSIATRTVILNLLCKSNMASTLTPYCIQLFFSTLFGKSNAGNPKLHISCLGFGQGMIRNFADSQMKLFGPVLLGGMMKYMNWLRYIDPNSQRTTTLTADEATALKSLESLKIASLHALSSLGKRIPSQFASNVTLLEDLMHDLRDNKSVVLVSATQETLTSLCPTAATVSDALRNRLQVILTSNFENQEPSDSDRMDEETKTLKPTISSKFISQYYANRCFSYSDEFARYINLMGINDTNMQVVQEARLGLKPFKVVDNDIVHLKADDDSIQWPSFADTVSLIMSKRHPSAEVKKILSYATPTFQSMISFLHTLLKHHRGLHASKAVLAQQDSIHASYTGFFELLEEAITLAPSQPISHAAAEHFLDAIQFKALDVTGTYHDALMLRSNPISSLKSIDASIKALLGTLLSGALKPDTMKLVSKVIGVLSSSDEPLRRSVLNACFEALAQNKISTITRDITMGSIYGASAVLASCLRLGQTLPNQETDLTRIVELIQVTIDHAQKEKLASVGGGAYSTIMAACDALGAMARWSDQISEISSPLVIGLSSPSSKVTILDTVLSLLKHHDPSIVISAAYCLSNMCLGNRALISEKRIIDGLLGTFTVKSEESHFSIGEALSIVSYGWFAAVAKDMLVESTSEELKRREAQMNGPEAQARENKCMEGILEITLKDYLLSARPDTRMASAIWLLTLLKNCGAHPALMKQLKAIQSGYQQLLSDSNEILQEVAGKGLSQLYDLGDEETKKELVGALVNALQRGASSFKVTADTEIFTQGAVGETPSGDKLTTYRELVNLASEMGQPDLIYKFMQISSHNALWNSKKGAAFATGELANRAKSQIEPHLPQLVPKLYRASFDPNPKIAHSMNSILKTLVPDNVADMISKLIKPILRDLLDHCIDTQWRTREASCNALADVLAARDFEQVSDDLKELWDRCFRMLDDIKESVRKSAEGFQKSLATLTLRLCDPSYTNREHGRQAIEIALPHLIAKGLVSPVKEVRYISIDMLQKLAKVASFLLKPHIADLVPVLLTTLATLDSAQLNYLEQHSASIGLSPELFDEARVSISKASPLHATIDTCIQQVDTENIMVLAPKLATLLGPDNHVSTRAGTASVVTQLALTKPEAVKNTAHRLMLALRKGLGARSSFVRKAYGYAMGQLSRCAKKKTLETVITALLDSYKNSTPEEVDLRSAIAEALLELSKASVAVIEATPASTDDSESGAKPNSALPAEAKLPISMATAMDVDHPSASVPESSSNVDQNPISAKKRGVTPNQEGKASVPVLAPFYPLVVPVVFLARFDAREDTSKVFNKIWEECGVSLALYVPETVQTFSAALDASSWQMKQQGAKAMAKLAETLNLSEFSSHAPQLLQLLLNGLKGRTWNGKESLLHALSKLIVCCSKMWVDPTLVPTNNITPEILLQAISTEVMRKNLEYKKAALTCLTDVLLSFGTSIPDFNAVEKVQDMLMEQATSIHKDENETTENAKFGEKDEESNLSRSVRQMALQALCAAFPRPPHSDRQTLFLPKVLQVFGQTIKTANHQYTLKVAALNNLKTIFPKIVGETWDQVVSDDMWRLLLDDIFYPTLSDPKFTLVRSAACSSLTELLVQSKDSSIVDKFVEDISRAVHEADKVGQTIVSNERLLALLARSRK